MKKLLVFFVALFATLNLCPAGAGAGAGAAAPPTLASSEVHLGILASLISQVKGTGTLPQTATSLIGEYVGAGADTHPLDAYKALARYRTRLGKSALPLLSDEALIHELHMAGYDFNPLQIKEGGDGLTHRTTFVHSMAKKGSDAAVETASTYTGTDQINLPCLRGEGSPLDVATEKGRLDAIKILIAHGARPQNNSKIPTIIRTLIMILDSKEHGNISLFQLILKELIGAGADINAVMNFDFRLGFACTKGLPFISVILQMHEDEDAPEQGVLKLNMVQTVLELFADPNHRDENEGYRGGATPLHYALHVKHQRRAIIQLLLDAGADPRIKDNREKTFIDDLNKMKQQAKKIGEDESYSDGFREKYRQRHNELEEISLFVENYVKEREATARATWGE